MSWTGPGTGAHNYTFVCDSGCGANTSEHADTFAKAWMAVESAGWSSHKRVGHPWMYYCPKCSEQGEREHEEGTRRDEERERQRKRNAEYRGE